MEIDAQPMLTPLTHSQTNPSHQPRQEISGLRSAKVMTTILSNSEGSR